MMGVEPAQHGIFRSGWWWTRKGNFKTFLWHARQAGLKTIFTAAGFGSLLEVLIEPDCCDIFKD